MQVQSLGREDPLKEGTATHSSFLAWRIPWTEEPAELQSIGQKESDTTEATGHASVCVCIYVHTHVCIYIYVLFQILVHYNLLQDIEYSSLCYRQHLVLYLFYIEQRIDAETEAPMLWPSDGKTQLIRKDPDAGKD